MGTSRFRHIGKSVAAGAVAFAAVALTAGACVAFRAVPEVSDLMLMLDWFDSCRSVKACDFAPPGKVSCYALWENRWIGEEAFADGPRRVDFADGFL